MSDQSADVRETSMPSSLFSKAERRYLTRLAPALQNPPEPLTVAMWLEKAQAEGLDRVRDLSIRLPRSRAHCPTRNVGGGKA